MNIQLEREALIQPEEEVDTTDCLQYLPQRTTQTLLLSQSVMKPQRRRLYKRRRKEHINSLLVGRTLVLSQHCAVINHCCLCKVTFNHTDSETCSSQTIKQAHNVLNVHILLRGISYQIIQTC